MVRVLILYVHTKILIFQVVNPSTFMNISKRVDSNGWRLTTTLSFFLYSEWKVTFSRLKRKNKVPRVNFVRENLNKLESKNL